MSFCGKTNYSKFHIKTGRSLKYTYFRSCNSVCVSVCVCVCVYIYIFIIIFI